MRRGERMLKNKKVRMEEELVVRSGEVKKIWLEREEKCDMGGHKK